MTILFSIVAQIALSRGSTAHIAAAEAAEINTADLALSRIVRQSEFAGDARRRVRPLPAQLLGRIACDTRIFVHDRLALLQRHDIVEIGRGPLELCDDKIDHAFRTALTI